MRRKVLKQVVAVLLTAACVISGCGSSGGSTQTSGTQSSEAVEGTQEQQTVAAAKFNAPVPQQIQQIT